MPNYFFIKRKQINKRISPTTSVGKGHTNANTAAATFLFIEQPQQHCFALSILCALKPIQSFNNVQNCDFIVCDLCSFCAFQLLLWERMAGERFVMPNSRQYWIVACICFVWFFVVVAVPFFASFFFASLLYLHNTNRIQAPVLGQIVCQLMCVFWSNKLPASYKVKQIYECFALIFRLLLLFCCLFFWMKCEQLLFFVVCAVLISLTQLLNASLYQSLSHCVRTLCMHK